MYADTRYGTGERVPQVPRHQGSGQVSYIRGGTLASIGVRSYSFQFDDDVNRFLLPGYATVQKTLTALANDIRHLANPVCLDFLPVSAGIEDHAPMAMRSGDGRVYLSPSMASEVIANVVLSKTEPGASPTDSLTDRELEILERIGKGQDIKTIAKALHLSPKTVETHRAHIKEKLNLANARQVARYAVQWTSARGL